MPYSSSHLPVFTAPRRSPTMIGQVLDAHRALELAAAAGGALERRLLGDVLAEQRRFAAGAELVQVTAQAQDDFLGVEHLARVVGRAVLGAAAALHARVGLQRVDAASRPCRYRGRNPRRPRAAESG